MANSYLDLRRQLLVKAQNQDGGWGYFPGKQSWLEPTAYAALALHGNASTQEASDRGWNLIKTWRNSDGSARPASHVESASWSTALLVTVAAVRGEKAELSLSLPYLLSTSGVETDFWNRWLQGGRHGVKHPKDFKGWPWVPKTTSWVEPTVHSVIALHLARRHSPGAALNERIDLGREMVLAHRCPDGGWNYGNPRVLGFDLPSYPETTGLALIGLAGYKGAEVPSAIECGKNWLARTSSPLARAWLTLGLTIQGQRPEPGNRDPISDLAVTALEALGAPGGNSKLLTPPADWIE